jgi:hypothetical protein
MSILFNALIIIITKKIIVSVSILDLKHYPYYGFVIICLLLGLTRQDGDI